MPFEDRADYYVINTCSVTDNADKKCRAIVRQTKRVAPNSKVIMIGCYAQLQPKEISEIEGVDLVVGAKEKFSLHKHLIALNEKINDGNYSKYIAGEIEEVDAFIPSYSSGERTRTFLKVQDGCDYGCAFCTIPLARGKSRSATVDEVVQQAKEIAEQGTKEIVLTGVNIGDFGKGNFGNRKATESFLDLIKALDAVENIERFRISSIEPNLLNFDIIDFVASSKKFMPHFHIPLQSGSDVLLKKMRRRYLTDLYTERIYHIKKIIPNCCIGVDVIVGFPGETEELFLETYQYLNELPISYLHVFTYSERANTLAIEMDEVVPIEVRHKRSKQLRILSEKKKRAFYESHLTQNKPVLFEKSKAEGMMQGFTNNYIKVEMPKNEADLNTVKMVRLNQLTDHLIIKADKLSQPLNNIIT